jgi:hypothetical protein
MPKELGVRVFDMDETFSAEKVVDRCNFPRKESAGSTERAAKTPSSLVAKTGLHNNAEHNEKA